MNPPLTTRAASFRNGLTLLELLVVVSLVAILSLFAFPAFQRMKEKSNVVTCTASLRDFYIAVSLYTTDHSGTLPPTIASGNGTTYWRRSLLQYWKLPSEVEAMSRTPLNCPAVRRAMSREYTGVQGNEQFIPYAMNYYLSSVRLIAIQEPSTKLLATEAPMRAGSLPNEAVSLNLLLNYGRDYHAGAQNLLFVDGHIEPFRDIRRLADLPYSPEGPQNIWTP